MIRRLVILSLLLWPTGSFAATVTKTFVKLNTVNAVELSVVFNLDQDLKQGPSSDANANVQWQVRNDKGKTLASGTSVDFAVHEIAFKVDNPTREYVNAVVANEPIHLHLDRPVAVTLASYKIFTLNPEEAEALIRERGTTTTRQRELIEAHQLGTYLLSEDQFDLAREVDQADTTRAEYVASYRFLRPLASGLPVVWRMEGRIGTKSDNPLNFAEFALSARSDIVGGRLLSARGFLEGSFLGDQRFKKTTFNGSVGGEVIIPNFLDLTGRSGRLRPKPILTVGASYAMRPQDQSQFGAHDTSFEWFAQLDYYVPIANKFALSYQGKARYSDNVVTSDKIRALNTISISYDLPLEDLKALVKWETGHQPLVTEEGQRLLVGVVTQRLPF